jgi:hypothetical protein
MTGVVVSVVKEISEAAISRARRMRVVVFMDRI